MNAPPFEVIGHYLPTIMPADKWNKSAGVRCWKIGEDLTDLTRKLGLKPLYDPKHQAQTWTPWSSVKLHAEVHKYHPGTTVAQGFHKDGDLISGSIMDHSLVVWANKTPTEFECQGKIYQPEPYEVVIARNLECSHRRPDNAPKERFFFHQAVENAMLKQTATLRNWCAANETLYGTVYGHLMFDDGTMIRTSQIVKLDEQNNKAETLNTLYTLESKVE